MAHTRARHRTIAGTPLVALVGMACLSVIFNACFFPLTLMPEAVEGSYRLFNQAVCIAGVIGGVAMAPVVAKGGHAHLGIAGIAGYVALAVALCATSSVAPGDGRAWAAVAGAGCGAGLTVTLCLWLGILSCFPERTAALVLGWQALFGSVAFDAVGFSVKALTNEASLALCVVSAMLFMLVYQKMPQLGTGLSKDPSPLEGVAALHRRTTFAHTLVAPAVGFFLLVFIFGAAEAVAMGHDGSPYGDVVSYLGAPLGSALFLLSVYTSRDRDYATMVRAIYLVLLVAFWIPAFDVAVLVLSCGFHLTLLLLGSLLVDECASRRRTLILLAAGGLGTMRLLFLGGLYLPGRFGVPSYSYFASSSLLLFLAYAVFSAFILLTWHERRMLRQALDEALPDEGDARTGASTAIGAGAVQAARERAGGEEPAAGAEQPGAGGTADSEADALARIARRYDLTKREAEIFDLYAHGRDINVVCQTLVLSRNTVKGHAKNLYAKLGVHSKQELIDILHEEHPEG